MKSFYKLLAFTLINSQLFACCPAPEQSTTTIPLPIVEPNLPAPLNLDSVSWKIYNANDLKALIGSNPNIVLFTLTPDQDQALNKNLVELQRYILQLKQTVIYYQNLNTTSSSLK